MNKPNCCESCWSLANYPNAFCVDVSCTCHTAPTNKETTPEWEDRWEGQSFVKVLKQAADFKAVQYEIMIKLLRKFIPELLAANDEAWSISMQENVDAAVATATAEAREESVNRVRDLTASSRRKYLNQVVARGSKDHLNDVWREGYNNALVDIEERLDIMFGARHSNGE